MRGGDSMDILLQLLYCVLVGCLSITFYNLLNKLIDKHKHKQKHNHENDKD